MLVYTTVSLSVIAFGLYYELINSLTNINKKRIPDYFFVIPSFILLFIISAFRGNFTSDYDTYADLFKMFNQYSFSQIFQYEFNQEIGYVLYNKVIGTFTDNELYLFAVTSFIILLVFYSQIKKDSHYIWMSVLLFVAIGPFYTSFNIMRHILAATIIFAGSKYLYDRKLFKYILVVILASLFHTSSLIMVPFYFILNFKIRFRNIIFLFFGSLIVTYYLSDIVDYFRNNYYTAYTEASYGMTGAHYSSVVVPISVLLFTLMFRRYIDSNDIKQRVWFNATIFYAFFHIVGLQVEIIERLSEFFAPFIFLSIPLILFKMSNKNLRLVLMLTIIILSFSYNYIAFSGSGYDPYYFIWDSHRY